MESIRTPFQGVVNIIRFNWHFYVIAIILLMVLVSLGFTLLQEYQFYVNTIAIVSLPLILVSLLVSHYVYDRSSLYTFNWLKDVHFSKDEAAINIHAGFDETSKILSEKYPALDLKIFDFYNPNKHTEVSIKRARAAYPPYPGTYTIETSNIPLAVESTNKVFLILSAHEIRDENERKLFFIEIHRILKNNGKVILVEHLRDTANFLAYTVGFFHFFSKKNWKKVIASANLEIKNEFKITPFISAFILTKHGNTS